MASIYTSTKSRDPEAIPSLDPTTYSAGGKVEELNSANKFKINGAEFYCYFEISSKESPEDQDSPETTDPTNKIRFTKDAIVNLDIRESFFEPFVTGTITLNNPFDYIEDNHFTRGDGTDFLHVELCDWKTFHGKLPPSGPQDSLRYTFVLADESNSISKTDRTNNFKTYALLDKNYAKLNRQIPYGKAYPPFGESALVGDLIKQVLIDGLDEGDGIIGDIWHSGNHMITNNPGSSMESIFTPLKWKYSDLLKYLIRINFSTEISGEEMPVQTVLKFNRDTQKYTLEDISDIFAQNKALVIEGFGLGDLTGTADIAGETGPKGEGTNPNNPYSYAKVNQNEGALKNANLTSPMINYGNEFLVNYLIGHADAYRGTFSKDNIVYIANLIDLWDEHFVKVFKCVGGPPEPNLPISLEAQQSVKPVSFPELELKSVESLAKAQLISNLTFLNLQLSLDLTGDTERQPGRFIDIFKLNSGIPKGSSPNPKQGERPAPSDAKMLGRWFVTKVHHRFFKESYENVIQCAKTYIGPDVPPVKPIDTPIVAKPMESKIVDEPPPLIAAPDLGPEGQDVIDLDITIPSLPEGDGTAVPALLETLEGTGAPAGDNY
mgnify:CR=1 FL=1